MTSNSVAVGRIVIAKAGRDKGRALVIVQIVDDAYVRVADGDLRRLEKPKLKKVKHCALTNHLLDLSSEGQDFSEWTNKRLLNALKDFTNKAE